MSTTPTTIRIDDDLRKELEPRLKTIGLSLNGYLTLAAKQLVIQNKVPFEIMVQDEPNGTTERALLEAQSKQLGLIPDSSPSFKNVDDLMNFLNGDSVEK